MNENKRQILVTSALPYANGAIHLGHMLEYIQTDIWARFQRCRGHECYFAWADDAQTACARRARNVAREAPTESVPADLLHLHRRLRHRRCV